MPKKGKYVKFKNNQRKIKSRFIIWAGLEPILVSEYNANQNPEEPYTDEYQKVLLVVMAVNQHVLILSSVSLLRHT